MDYPHGERAPRLVACVLRAAILCTLLGALPASAAEQSGVPRSSLAHRVPAEAEVFIELGGLQRNAEQLRRAHLWTLVRVLCGETVADTDNPVDWQALVQRYLGMTPEEALTDLFGYRVVVAAPSWSRLADAVIVIRLRNPKVLAPVVESSRLKSTRQQGNVWIHETKAGLKVATDGQYAAFARTAGDGSMFEGVVEILCGANTPVLARMPDFAALVGGLSRGYMGYLFIGTAGEQGGSLAGVLPDLRATVVGMYVRGERLDFEVSAKLSEPRDQPQRALVDVNRLERLPDTTLLAWATSCDWYEAYDSLLEGDVSADMRRYIELIRSVLDADAFRRDVVAWLAPRVILVWDRLRGGPDTPQLAILLESWDAEGVALDLATTFAEFAERLRNKPASEEAWPLVYPADNLDTEILTVPLMEQSATSPDFGSSATPRFSMQPSFAAMDGWVIIAASPEHVVQLLKAHEGWIPSLGSISELQADQQRFGPDAVLMAVGQPAMASAVLTSWRNERESAGASLFGRLLARRQAKPTAASSDQRKVLGIGIRKDEAPGSVMVVRVDEDKPAGGLLQIGDRIIGVDGKLLSLDSPGADLRAKIAQRTKASLSIRVRRDGQILDVVIPLPKPAAKRSESLLDPAEVLRQLQILGRSLSYAVYSVAESPPDQFRAHVSLRLVPVKTFERALSTTGP